MDYIREDFNDNSSLLSHDLLEQAEHNYFELFINEGTCTLYIDMDAPGGTDTTIWARYKATPEQLRIIIQLLQIAEKEQQS